MSEITLYNDSTAQMTVMAWGKAVDWNPKTTMLFSEAEAEKLLKVGDHIKKFEDVANNSEVVNLLKQEIEDLKAEIESLKNPKIEDLKNPKNIK